MAGTGDIITVNDPPKINLTTSTYSDDTPVRLSYGTIIPSRSMRDGGVIRVRTELVGNQGDVADTKILCPVYIDNVFGVDRTASDMDAQLAFTEVSAFNLPGASLGVATGFAVDSENIFIIPSHTASEESSVIVKAIRKTSVRQSEYKSVTSSTYHTDDITVDFSKDVFLIPYFWADLDGGGSGQIYGFYTHCEQLGEYLFGTARVTT